MGLDIQAILADTLFELCDEKALSKITVSDIVQKSGVSRQTFYNHFTDKYALIDWIYRKKADKILDAYNENGDWFDCIQNIVDLFLDNKKYYTQACELSGQNAFTDFFYQYTRDYYINSIAKRFGRGELTDELLSAIQFNSFGAVNIHLLWVRDGMTVDPKIATKRILNNMPEIMRKYFM